MSAVGAGVAVRLVDHGLMESTAELRYDLSDFLAAAGRGILAEEDPVDSHATACPSPFAAETAKGADGNWWIAAGKTLAPACSASVVTFLARIGRKCAKGSFQASVVCAVQDARYEVTCMHDKGVMAVNAWDWIEL